MATDNVQISNMALDLIGSRYIASMAETSKEAKACNRNYDTCRKQVLRDYPWNFATKKVILDTADATAPEFGFANRFPLPEDFVRVHTALRSDGCKLEAGEYEIVGAFIETDESEIWLKYVFDQDDTTTFDPLFDKALACHLALSIAYLITASESRNEALRKDYMVAIREAKYVDTVEEPSRLLDSDEWIRSRFGVGDFVRDPKTN